ncbi:MAG: HEAT repeat domain-containing protein [Treponema sp.]|nr:HEAT repeat domain-containing protein [Treponema sp.]
MIRILPAEETEEPAPVKTLEEQRLDTLRYGTETEIAALIQTVKNEKNSDLDVELITLAESSKNRNILAGVFSFFAEMEKKGLEARAVRAIEERDDEAGETVLAAVDYLGKLKSAEAAPSLRELVDAGESRFTGAAIRALGRSASGGGKGSTLSDETAEYLEDYYTNRNPPDENRREIIGALGETGSGKAVPFLSQKATNSEERVPLRMAALEAIAKIADPRGLPAVIEAVSSEDPNLRSSAISALGPFSGEAVDKAILEGFRDSYYRTRIGASQAAGRRKLEAAIPYLRYRAERDDVPAVKDEAIRALGSIDSGESRDIIESLFKERKNSDRVRLLAVEMLVRNDGGAYVSTLIVELDEAKRRNQTPLYNGFLRVLGTARSSSLEDLARRFISSGGIIEKSLALDIAVNNEFRGLAEDIRTLLDEKKYNPSLVRKARTSLEKLGLE